MTDMKHMEYLETVASDDVRVLREKEGTYRGSWKAAGGRSAWFMARRNMDRLLVMMAAPVQPEGFNPWGTWRDDPRTSGDMTYVRKALVAEDIFLKIQEHPGGEDGTVLASVRDLRRYLMLVEAEMIARGVVHAVDKTSVHDKKISSIDPMTMEPYPYKADSKIVMEPKRPPYKDGKLDVEREQVTRTPEDGSHHATTAPWVCGPGYFSRKDIDVVTREKFWNLRAPGVHVLEPCVEHGQVPQILRHLYRGGPDKWFLRIELCPPDARDYFPNLEREKNRKEHEELPPWQRHLYRWNESGNKFELAEQHAAWHVEAE